MATKTIEDAPVSMLKEEQFFLKGYRPPFKNNDPMKNIGDQPFETSINKHFMTKEPAHKMPIR